MAIVVVEGPDGSGKTNLIRNLRKEAKEHYLCLARMNPPTHVSEITRIVHWVEKVFFLTPNLVLDRHPLISEPIYGPLLRGENLLEGHWNTDDIRQHFATVISRVIYCRPPTSVIYRELQKDEQLKGVAEKIEEITHQYDCVMKLLNHWGVRVVKYDWTAEKAREQDNISLDRIFFGAP